VEGRKNYSGRKEGYSRRKVIAEGRKEGRKGT
jgi:hypothetical protein